MIKYWLTLLIALLLLWTLDVPADQERLGDEADTVTVEGVTSLLTVPGKQDVEVVHIDVDVSAQTAFMIIDLSDTTNWPHSKKGHIDLAYIFFNVNPTTTFAGDIELGFLTDVGTLDGDFHGVFEVHMDKKQDSITEGFNFGAFGMDLELAHWFGPTVSNSILFQTDVNLAGPDGNTSFPSGNGDFVMIVDVSTSSVAFGLTVGYFAED